MDVNEGANWLISDNLFIGNIFLYEAKLQPIFRGELNDIYMTDRGVGYGSSTIIDFNRQPEVEFISGSGAALQAVINNGEIVQIIVQNKGKGYNSPPNLQIVSETGKFAVLVPVVDGGGGIKEVIVRKGGAGYQEGKTPSWLLGLEREPEYKQILMLGM